MEAPEVAPKRKKGRPRKTDKIILESSNGGLTVLHRPDSLGEKTVEEAIDVVNALDTSTADVDGAEVPEKKRRGRKKKEKADEVKQKKKRGRKAAVKYFSSSIRKKIPLTTVLQNSDNYILHLDIKDEDINDDNAGEEQNEGYESSANCYGRVEEDNSDSSDDTDDVTPESLKGLYDSMVKERENQDDVLFSKLQTLHTDEHKLLEMNASLLAEFNEDSKEPDASNESTLATLRTKEQDVCRKKGYFHMLYDFVHSETWHHKTDVCCWWCCHQFDGVPVGLPVHFNCMTRKFRVKGVFCSFNCMLAYRNEVMPSKRGSDYLINYLYSKMTGVEYASVDLKPAPSRFCLQMFGGELTIDEFRESAAQQKVFRMIHYPMFMSRDYVEEVDIANIKNVNAKLFADADFSTIVKLDDQRVMEAKRRIHQMEKTTITVGNTIDKLINIS